VSTGRKISIGIIVLVAALVAAETIRQKREDKRYQTYGKADSLIFALDRGNPVEIQALINNDRLILNATSVKGGSLPLHRAVWLGRMDIIQLLITNGAAIDGRDDWGATPLHCAAGKGDKQLAEFFLSKGVDVNSKADGGITPLILAVASTKNEVVQFLISKGANTSAKSRTLETAGSDFDLEKRYTPLQWAEHIGAKEIAATLRRAGAKE
jgi:ankyrin repeat protein